MSISDQEKESPDIHHEESRSIWIRGGIMLLLVVCFGVAQSVLYAMAVVQFFWMLIAKERNAFLADFGWSLGQWLAEAARFLTGGTDEKPFPWKKWPSV